MAIALVLAAALAAIFGTYHTFDQTWDEGAHIAGGMEWLDRGTYTYEPMHTPLARIAVAIGPYLAGARSHADPDWWAEGNRILGSGARYERLLTLARLGTIPFFLLAVFAAFAWARRLGGDVAGVATGVMLVSTPPILAEAGIATTDMALTAMVTLSLYLFWRWRRAPSRNLAILLGIASGLAIGSKLSALVFLPAGFVAIWLCTRFEPAPQPARARGQITADTTRGFGACFLVLWALYRFSVGPILPPHAGNAAAGAGRTESAIIRILDAPVFPAPELARGVVELAQRNAVTKKNYLFGVVQSSGRWDFFPVALSVKTPLPLLLLAGAGAAAAFAAHRTGGSRSADALAPAAAGTMILLSAMPADLNIGVRHVLPVYPLLAIMAGIGMAALLKRSRPAITATVGALVLWQLTGAVHTYPDYLAYFNELAGRHPEHILVDGDLDTGQDLKRMVKELRRRGVDSEWIAYAGSRDLRLAGLPPFRLLPPRTRVRGWIAMSMYKLYLGPVADPSPDGYAWLRTEVPVARVGRSMLLYHLP